MRVGIKGQADLNGWIRINGLPIRLEVEVKSGNAGIKKNSPQGKWREMCRQNNVIHIEAKCPLQVVQNLKEIIEEIKGAHFSKLCE